MLLVVALTGAIGIIVKLIILDAPPSNSVLITSSNDEAQSIAAVAIETPLRSKTTPTFATKKPKSPSRPVISPTLQIATETNAETPVSQTDLPTNTATAVPQPDTPVPTPTSGTPVLQVYVSGEVKRPGVYALPEGARVADALTAASGPSDAADLEGINLAARLSDEEHVAVPRKGATPASEESPAPLSTPVATARKLTQTPVQKTPTAAKSVPAGKVNINKASESELETLPGIGPSLAGKIIAFRAANGPFGTIEDIEQVPGIKSGLFAKIRAFITVGP